MRSVVLSFSEWGNRRPIDGYAAGEPNLTYTWSVADEPPNAPDPAFSANGSNAAKNTTATFAAQGAYTFQVTITDQGKLSTTTTVDVTVNPTLTSLVLSPETVTLQENQQQAFTATALDQFGNPLATQPAFTWAVPNGFGSVTSSGVYTAPSSGLNGSATVTVSTPNPAGGAGATLGASASITVSNPGPTITAVASASPTMLIVRRRLDGFTLIESIPISVRKRAISG